MPQEEQVEKEEEEGGEEEEEEEEEEIQEFFPFHLNLFCLDTIRKVCFDVFNTQRFSKI